MDLDQLRTFYALATSASFTEAAKKLSIDKSSVSRHLQALEHHFNQKLIHRSTKKLTLTSAGGVLFKSITSILGQIKALDETVFEDPSRVSGVLSIQTTHGLLTSWLSLFLDEFIKEAPLLHYKLTGSNTPLDFEENEIHVAIQSYIEGAPHLIQEPLMRWKLSLYASKGYIERFGMPERFEDLQNHRLIVFEDLSMDLPRSYTSFPLLALQKENRNYRPLITTNSVSAMYNLVNQDAGIGLFSKDSPFFSKYQFIPILPDVVTTEIQVFYIYPESLKMTTKIRMFGDFLQRKIKEYSLYGSFRNS